MPHLPHCLSFDNAPAFPIILGPMEGISDGPFKKTILELFPQWDFVAGEFLRAPSVGYYKENWIIDFFGKDIFYNPEYKKKSIFQILTCTKAKYTDLASQIRDLDFPWLDLNIGCPSRTVNNHGAGAILLNHPEQLALIVGNIRKAFPSPRIFSVKMRLGYENDAQFFSNVQILLDQGVDYITIHGRTRQQLYTGVASWQQSESVAKTHQLQTKAKFIGNGDIWTPQMFEEKRKLSLFYALMLSRPALKYPWFPLMLEEQRQNTIPPQGKAFFQKYAHDFFSTYTQNILQEGIPEMACLKRLKALSRYIFEDLDHPEKIKKIFFRTETLEAFLKQLKEIESQEFLKSLEET